MPKAVKIIGSIAAIGALAFLGPFGPFVSFGIPAGLGFTLDGGIVKREAQE